MTSDAQGFLVGLVGSGIGPSLSPPLHEREADELGVRYLYRRLDLDRLQLPASAIGEILAAARLAGFARTLILPADAASHRATVVAAVQRSSRNVRPSSRPVTKAS